MRQFKALLATAILLTAAPLAAQENSLGEIIVTAQRSSSANYTDEQPVIGLRRPADSAVQPIWITSDSRDEATRKREIHEMLLSAIKRADAAGVQLVSGNFDLIQVTAANYRDLVFERGNRPDMSRIDLYVKAKLAGSTGDAQKRLDDFIRAVPASGRSLMEKRGELTLTIINPDQYRDQIVKLVAAAAHHSAAAFGTEYGVSVSGLDGELAWSRISGTEVFLYIPYRFTIQPK